MCLNWGALCKLHLNYKHNKYYSQWVEGAQTLKGVRGQLRYLVITQVSVKANAKGKKSTQNQRQIGIEPEKQAAKEKKKAREKRNIEVSTLHKRESVTQCGHFLLYLHPSQLLIWRKSPGWDHLDGVLLQSSGTKHTHTDHWDAALTSSYRSAICAVSLTGACSQREHFQIRLFDDRCQSLSQTFALFHKRTVNVRTSKHALNYLGSCPLSASLHLCQPGPNYWGHASREKEGEPPNKTDPNYHSLNISHI